MQNFVKLWQLPPISMIAWIELFYWIQKDGYTFFFMADIEALSLTGKVLLICTMHKNQGSFLRHIEYLLDHMLFIFSQFWFFWYHIYLTNTSPSIHYLSIQLQSLFDFIQKNCPHAEIVIIEGRKATPTYSAAVNSIKLWYLKKHVRWIIMFLSTLQVLKHIITYGIKFTLFLMS